MSTTTPPISPRPNFSRLTTLMIEGLQAKNITDKDTFIKFSVDGKKFRTKVHKKTQNPSWSDKFTVTTTETVDLVLFQIYSQNIIGNDIRVGSIKIPIVSPNSIITTPSPIIITDIKPNGGSDDQNITNTPTPTSTIATTPTPTSTIATTPTPTTVISDVTSPSIPTSPPISTSTSTNEQTLTSAQISSSPSISNNMNNVSSNNRNSIMVNSNSIDGIASMNSNSITSESTSVFEIFTIDCWTPVDRDIKPSSNSPQTLSELRVKIMVKIRDIYFDTDTNTNSAQSIDDSSSSGIIGGGGTNSNSNNSNNNNVNSNNINGVQAPPKDYKPEPVNPKEMSFIGKGGSQILKLKKKITSRIDKTTSSSSSSSSSKNQNQTQNQNNVNGTNNNNNNNINNNNNNNNNSNSCNITPSNSDHNNIAGNQSEPTTPPLHSQSISSQSSTVTTAPPSPIPQTNITTTTTTTTTTTASIAGSPNVQTTNTTNSTGNNSGSSFLITNNSGSGSNNKDSIAIEKARKEQERKIIEEQLAKEQESERIEKEKAMAREKLRQLEQEEIHKKIEAERREARKREKEEKKKLEREKKYVPDRPIDYFFVCGLSSTKNLDPLDQLNEQQFHNSHRGTSGNTTTTILPLPLEKSYKGELLDYYPHKEEKDLIKEGILPKHIWMYCFPRGINFKTEQPQPSFFPFVLTNETGQRFYASCLTFYEQINDSIYQELHKETLDSKNFNNLILNNNNNNNLNNLNNNNLNDNNNNNNNEQNNDVKEKDIESLIRDSTISEANVTAISPTISSSSSNSSPTIGNSQTTTIPTAAATTTTTTTTTSSSSSSPQDSNSNTTSVTNTTTTTNNSTNSSTTTTTTIIDDFPIKLYAPKCICVLSHFPFFSSFRVALNEIYHRVFHNPSPIPIERYIFNLVSEIQLPRPGKNPVTFSLGGLNQCLLKQPDPCLLPEPDISYRMLFLSLDIKNVLSLTKCLLLEEKILIISSQYTLLTYICEIITTLIHPLVYTHIYVPVLPEVLVDIAGSTPFPFIMGIHRSYADRILSKEDLLNELVIVDLDNNSINIPTSTKDIQLPEKETQILINQLKKVVQFEILSSDLPNFNPNTLSSIKTSNNNNNNNSNSNNNNSNDSINNKRSSTATTTTNSTTSTASTTSSRNSTTNSQPIPPPLPTISSNPDQHIRFSFLQYFCNLLHDYRKYYKYLRVFPQPVPIFNNEEYIKSKAVASRPFISMFIKTQAFIYFLEQHSWPTKNLFDYLVHSKRYQKLTIDELQQQYQSQIPLALGLIDPFSVNTIQSSNPSSIKSSHYSSYQSVSYPSQHNSTLKEYSKFPSPLKLDLFGSITSSPSSTSSTSTSLTSSSTSLLNQDQLKPLYDIYNNNNNIELSNNNNNNNNNLSIISSSLQQFSFNEDQHKSFVILIEKFLDKIFSDQVPVDDIQQILDVLQFDYGRHIFGKLLLNHHKQNYVGSNVSQMSLHSGGGGSSSSSNSNTKSGGSRSGSIGSSVNHSKTKLSDLIFNCLVDIIRFTLRECNTQLDFISSQLFLESIFIYHRIFKGQNEYLHEKLQTNIDLWQNQKFWEKLFYDHIEAKCKNLYGVGNSMLIEMVEWSIKNDDTKKELIKQEEDMAFSLFSNQTFKMITLGSTPDLVRRFVNRMCASVNLDSDTMLQVVSNMSRARELSDLDSTVNNGINSTKLQDNNNNNELVHRKHIMREKEDSYQLITKIGSGKDSKNNKVGNEIFQNLFDEKGHVSLNKIMNIKSTWEESKSSKKKDSTKNNNNNFSIKEISESRGDYVVKLFTGHSEGVLCSTISQRENNLLITGSADSTLKVWDVTTTKCINTLSDHSGWVTTCEIMGSDGSKLLSGSYDKTIKYWDLQKGQKIKSFRGHKGSITCLVNQDSNIFVSGSNDNNINVWDSRSHKPAITLFGHQQAVMCLVVNDQYRVISGSNDSNIRVWDIRTSTSTNVLSGHSDWIKCLEVDSTDTLISGSCDGRVKVWSLDNGECIKTLQSHSGSVNSILVYGKVDTDGTTAPKKFLTASSDSTLKVWDSNYGESYHCLEGHTDEVVNLSKFINNFVVSASFDGTVKLWDVDNGKCKRTLYNHSNRISSLTTYDSSIVTTSWDKNAKIIQFNLDFRGR
ncbi:hypothetical protein ACTFIW_002570 [Dictyostelium discoideum]